VCFFLRFNKERKKLKVFFLILKENVVFFSIFANAEDVTTSEVEDLTEDSFVHDKSNATIQILNKITAKAKYINIPVKSEINYGTLLINVKECWKSSPYDLLENKISLTISEKKTGEKTYKTIFNGWMFSSSPGISSLEHSVYDIVAINCYD